MTKTEKCRKKAAADAELLAKTVEEGSRNGVIMAAGTAIASITALITQLAADEKAAAEVEAKEAAKQRQEDIKRYFKAAGFPSAVTLDQIRRPGWDDTATPESRIVEEINQIRFQIPTEIFNIHVNNRGKDLNARVYAMNAYFAANQLPRESHGQE